MPKPRGRINYIVRHINLDRAHFELTTSSPTCGPWARGGRVFSAYELRDGTRIWIITEADRSVTTILLPEEYEPAKRDFNYQ